MGKWSLYIGLGLYMVLLIMLSFWHGKNENEEYKKCGIGVWLSIIFSFGTVIGFCQPTTPLTILIGCVSFVLFIIGLYLVIRYRKYLRAWTSRMRSPRR